MPNKKILIITYYWPPAGGPGVQRWLKFVKYLPSYGFQPIVYVPDNPTYPIIDQGLLAEISSEAIILKNKIVEPYQIATFFSKNKTKNISAGIIPNQKKQSIIVQLLLWIRGNIFIPDARFLWVKPSVKFLHQYIIANNIQTIVTSGPPHSLHLIGYQLQKKVQVKWIADFRDPWTTIGYHKQLKLSAFAEKKHKKLEHQVLNAADAIIVTSKSTKIEFEKLTAKPITVITNGFDTENNVKQTLDSKFSLSHIGSFLSERNPKILWESLSELCVEIENFKNNLQIKLIGAVSDVIFQTITNFKLTDSVLNLGYISHHHAIDEQQKSQVLLLIEIDSADTKSIIPGKLFEYLASGRPILAIGPKDSDFAEIIINTNTGAFFEYHQKQLLKAKIVEYYNLFLNQNLIVNAIGIDKYSRKNLTLELTKLL